MKRDGSRAFGNDKMTAIAICEHGSDKFAKVIRFLYNVLSIINENLRTWIAVPKGCILNNVLFNNRDNLGAVVRHPSPPQDQKDFVQAEVLRVCTVLSVGQRCADWFVLRQFRITGTNAGKILMESRLVRASLGIQTEREGRTHASAVVEDFL